MVLDGIASVLFIQDLLCVAASMATLAVLFPGGVPELRRTIEAPCRK
jgi:hypothetical protein